MTGRDVGGKGKREGQGKRVSLRFPHRFWLYGAVLIILLPLWTLPRLRSYLEDAVPAESPPPSNRLIVAGLDLAPVLIPRLVDTYQRLYPELDIRMQRGGTRQALEDLFNRRADVAFLSRPMTNEEISVVQAIGDTALSFPIALGAIAVLIPREATIDSLPVSDLRDWIRNAGGEGTPPESASRRHIYAPDPNLGLWTALTEQLDLPETLGESVIWLATDHDVATAVGNDRLGLGFASLLALPEDLDRIGVRTLRITASADAAAVIPEEGEVATGGYPLYHYLYAACRPEGGATASGFVSFLHSGRGQRLVAREGFLPARDVPREIHLTRQPVVSAG
jgi:ABC-type phosphate transport system substrate-binding protein